MSKAPGNRPPSFEDMLQTWDSDTLRLTLTTGEVVAGQVQVAHDLKTVWVVGEFKTMPTGDGPKLYNTDRERGYRVANVIGIEFLVDNSSPAI